MSDLFGDICKGVNDNIKGYNALIAKCIDKAFSENEIYTTKIKNVSCFEYDYLLKETYAKFALDVSRTDDGTVTITADPAKIDIPIKFSENKELMSANELAKITFDARIEKLIPSTRDKYIVTKFAKGLIGKCVEAAEEGDNAIEFSSSIVASFDKSIIENIATIFTALGYKVTEKMKIE